MRFFDFIFGNKNQQKKDISSETEESKIGVIKTKIANPSVKSISDGVAFDFEFSSMSVVKQYYNNHSEEVCLSSPMKVHIMRLSTNGEVVVTFSNLSELKDKGVINQNPKMIPHFGYQSDNKGNEFASAEINNSFSTVASGKEYISLFQISKQKGKYISFLINNLPGDQDFYYLLIMRDESL